jgi:hypothetical protein
VQEESKSEANDFMGRLEKFDSCYDTVIDYFAVIGFDEGQLRSQVDQIENIADTSEQVALTASVLDRFPAEDRSTIAFPPEIVNFFFSGNERI